MLVPSQHQPPSFNHIPTVHTHPFQSLRGPKGYLGDYSPPYGGGDGGGAAPLGVGGRSVGCWVLYVGCWVLPISCCLLSFPPLLPLYIPSASDDEEQDHDSDIGDCLSGRDTCWVEVEHHSVFTWLHTHSTEDIVYTSNLGRLSIDSCLPTRVVDLREDYHTTVA